MIKELKPTLGWFPHGRSQRGRTAFRSRGEYGSPGGSRGGHTAAPRGHEQDDGATKQTGGAVLRQRWFRLRAEAGLTSLLAVDVVVLTQI